MGKDLVKTHVGPDGQEIAHAVVMAHQASPIVYKDGYNKNVLGQGPANPAIAFPENDRLKKIHDKTGKPNYQKDAKKEMQQNMLPVDTPEFIRAKQVAKNASDNVYNKQKAEVVKQNRGYQTMEAKEHPDVKKSEKAKGMSDLKYKEGYEQDKAYIMFPYTITPEYETKSSVKRMDNEYTKDHEQTKDKNHFDVTSTPVYENQKAHGKVTAEINYKQEFEKNKGKMLGTDVTPEMARAHEMEPIRNKQKYQEQAKKDLVKTHVGPDGQEIAHAVVMSHKASPLVYKNDYNKNVLGQGPASPAIAFPENDRLKKIHDKTSKPNYQKEAKKEMQQNSLPVDTPEFIRAKQVAKNASDNVYNKQKAEVVKQNRGYQTMEAKEHPDVKKAEKANGMSDLKYKEDYEQDKAYVVFPYTITPEYETKASVKKMDANYKTDYDSLEVA